MKKLFSLLGITSEAETPNRAEAVEMIGANPEQIAEAFDAARQEIAKLRKDNAWVENRLREDIESLRKDRLDLTNKVDEKDRQIVALEKEVESAKDSAADQAREMLRGAGHTPVADANHDPDAVSGPLGTDEKIFHDYQAMAPGADRLAFAEKNRESLERYTSSL